MGNKSKRSYSSWEEIKERADARLPSSKVILGSNAKVIKGNKEAYLTACIHLAPADESVPFGGENMCVKAKSCKMVCLNKAGRHRMPTHATKRVALTLWFLKDRKTFLERAVDEARALIKAATRKGFKAALRPNGLSDRRDMAYAMAKALENDPIDLYDYTKLPLFKPSTSLPKNYHLTFSRDESNWSDCLRALSLGYNVAVVFGGPLPATYEGFEVVDGDEDDLRFIKRSEKPVIVGLKFKGGNAAKDLALDSGFCVNPNLPESLQGNLEKRLLTPAKPAYIPLALVAA